MGNQQSLPPENDLPSLEDRMKHHTILRNYRIDAPLEPGSGRFMKTYRIKQSSCDSSSSGSSSGGGGGSGNPMKNVTAVLKTGWVCINNVVVDDNVSNMNKNNTDHSSNTTSTAAAVAAAEGAHPSHPFTTTTTTSTTTTTTASLYLLQTQRAELQHLREILEPQTHIAPFVAWYSSEQDDRGNTYQTFASNNKGGGAHPTAATALSSAAAAAAASASLSSPSSSLLWRPFYLLRPHFYTTLQDRLQSRPFLHTAEKLFLASQLLQAVAALHDEAAIVHGFLTTSNVALTATNWLVLTDLATVVKQDAVLAQDDPSDFLYYFAPVKSKAANKRCYLAPERFVDKRRSSSNSSNNKTTAVSSQDKSATGGDFTTATSSPSQQIAAAAQSSTRLTPAMDIFSVGCVLTEVFLNGEPCLELGDLLEYKTRGELTPTLQQKLHKVERSAVRAACKHMLQLDPKQRLSAAAYWERWMETEERFPHEILTKLVEKVTTQTTTPDARLALAAQAYGQVLWECVGVRDEQGQAYFDQVLGFPSEEETVHGVKVTQNDDATAETDLLSLSDTQSLLLETEALLAQLDSLQLDDDTAVTESQERMTSGESKDRTTPSAPKTVERSALSKSSLLIYLQVIVATVPHVQRPASKLVALQLLKRLAKYSSDEARLQRIVPVAVSLLQDQDVLVKASAIQVLSYTLSIVESFSPSDSQIFPQYIFKRVGHLISDPSLVVRLAFARCIAVLAETAQRFLDITHAVRLYEAVGSTGNGVKSSDEAGRGEGETAVFGDNIHKLLDTESRNSSKLSLAEQTEASADSTKSETSSVLGGRTLISSTYKVELAGLQETVSRWVVQLTTDQSNHASFSKRAVLRDLGRLCAFFGVDGVMAFILPQILAFLNERKDWELRAALFEQMPCVCHVIGRAATEEYVLPCVEIGLVDCEEQVISQALQCLSELVKMGLLSRFALVGSTLSAEMKTPNSGLLAKYGVLFLHPSVDIRNSAILAFSAMCKLLGPLDTEVYALPHLSPFLRFKPPSRSMATVPSLQRCLSFPWSRGRFSQELDLIASLVQGTHQTPGAWTSIGISVTDANMSTEASPAHKGTDDSAKEVDPQVQRFRDYLSMLLKHTASFPSQERATPGTAVSTGIEGSVKLAQNIMFPRQNGRDQQGVIPTWFNSLRDNAKSNNLIVSADSAIRSVSSLGQVYGLSIMGPAGGAIEGVVDAADEVEEGTEISSDMLHTKEALNIEAAFAGRWGSEATLDPEAVDTCLLVTKLKSMRVPPLPPQLGGETTTRKPPPGRDPSSAKNWKPKMNAMVATSSTATGHSAPVVRLAVSMDQKFFISGSHDGTCRIWDIPQIDDCSGMLESSTTYSGHSTSQLARINDVAMLEGSHSVVSGASDGYVHVWRVDLNVSAKSTPLKMDSPKKIRGTTVLQRVNPGEGEVLAVSHFNTLSSSVITYATQKGFVHSWDLRCAKEPFALKHDPSLGNLSALALGSDRNWLVAGTSNGFITLWDIRFQQPVTLWKHNRSSAISRLATSYVFSQQHSGDTSGGARPYIFVASGPNECGMFDVLSGSCKECFRVAEGDSRKLDNHIKEPPALELIRMNSSREGNVAKPLKPLSMKSRIQSSNSFNCMIGSVGAGEHSYLLTGGSDSCIRFWDFSVPSKCFIVSGSQQGQPRPGYERIDFDGTCRLMLCRESVLCVRDEKRQFRGLKKPEHYHKDSIEDLRIIDNSSLLSCSRDCTVKVWR